MDFIINKNIIKKYPNVKIGLLIAENITNKTSSKEFIKNSLELQEKIKNELQLNTLVENPKIQNWREAYSKFGAKPKTYKNSVEALLRRILKGNNLPNINQIVDIYNYISIKYIIPAGGDDIDKIDGDITLTFSDGIKKFTILGSNSQEDVSEGEVVYADNNEILCRKWNWRECDKSKMTDKTKNVCLVIEGLKSISEKNLKDALKELQQLVEKYCGVNSKTIILNSSNTKAQIR